MDQFKARVGHVVSFKLARATKLDCLKANTGKSLLPQLSLGSSSGSICLPIVPSLWTSALDSPPKLAWP